MGKKEKAEEREEGLLMETKLKKCLVLEAKRKGNCSTPPPKWKLKDDIEEDETSNAKRFTELSSPMVSARKLCANLWDIESHRNQDSQVSRATHRTRRTSHKNNDQDEAANFGRAASAPLIEYRRSIESNDDDRAIQPVSPANYSTTSIEVVPCKHSLATASSLDQKFKMVRPNYGLKTSTELINVLNRIWSLEEQNASNASTVRKLKAELNRTRGRVEELKIEKESDRREISELYRKSDAAQSARQEFEDEKKLRKRSEALHRKLARENSELRSSFSNALRELERERKARMLLESLCDEFAKGISEYEHEVRAFKHRAEIKERAFEADRPNKLILHISEAWLDERTQMKLAEEENNVVTEKTTIVEKLGCDIATFLRAKQSAESKSRRYSLESFPLNETMSAPRNQAEEGDSSEDNDLGSLVEAKKIGGESLEEATEGLGGVHLDFKTYSPVQPWNSKLMTPDFEKSECSSRWPQDLDENTLMTQLIEARLERRRRSNRNKSSKDSF